MKELNVYELFNGYEDITIPNEIDENVKATVTLSASEIEDTSILFVTFKGTLFSFKS